MGLALQVAIYLLAFGCGAGLLYLALHHFAPQLSERLQRQQAEFERILADLFFDGVTPRSLALLKYVAAPASTVLIYLLTGSLLFALLPGILLWLAPDAVLRYSRRKRLERLEGQVLELISSINATCKAGMSLRQSIEEVATRMPAPMGQEFGMVLDRVRAGQSLSAALEACDERAGVPNLSLVLQSIILNERRGGHLPELLEKIHASLREIERVEERVKTETSGIKLSSRIMAAMPLLVGLLLYTVAPQNVAMLFNSLLGNLILLLALLFDFVGFTMIRRLSRLEV